jgi:hypothetical protein
MELFELFCCMLEGMDLVAIIADGIAWVRSEPNREARRAARREGAPPPPASGWTKALYILTPIAIVLTILIVIKWVRPK